ncbi:MAG: serine/threonine-protein kinase [Myxococcota bacterium]
MSEPNGELDRGFVGPKPDHGHQVVIEMMRAQVEQGLFGPSDSLGSSVSDQSQGTTIDRALHTVRSGRRFQLGRFEIDRLIGRGGMGEVFAAHDPRLDRLVAIKLLRAPPGEYEVERNRLRREAAALACLNHPNIVQVYDVGEVDEQVYIAMEFVEGFNLRRWLTQQPRSTAEVVEVFVQAGRGLAAAHARGVVHRDFKPGNILVGNDGRVRVIDFGLARRAVEPETPDDASTQIMPKLDGASTAHRRAVALGTVTRRGLAVGTPGYMAPEHRAGLPSVAATDQYAFCVSLFESLTGVLPSASRSTSAVAALPVRLRSVIVRGMAERSEDRWPSMDALLEALARASTRSLLARGWASWLVGGVLLGGGLWLGAGGSLELADTGVDRDGASSACDQARGAAIWGQEQREVLTRSVEASGAAHVRESWDWVQERLDEYADGLDEREAPSCTAPAAATTESASCLVCGQAALSATVRALREDVGLLAYGPELVAILPRLDSCTGSSSREPGFDAELAERLAGLRIGLVSRKLSEAPRPLLDLVEQAEQTPGWGSRRQALELELLAGKLQVARHQIDDARSHVESVYARADDAGYAELAREAALVMSDLAPSGDPESDDEDSWLQRACAGVEGASADERQLHCARIESVRNGAERAIEHLESSLVSWSSSGDAIAPTLAQGWLDLASLRLHRGNPGAAQLAVTTAASLVSRTLGTHHPRYAEVVLARAALYELKGDDELVLTELGDALSILESIHGEYHPVLSWTLEWMGRIHGARGEFDRAIPLMQRALKIRESTQCSSQFDVARTLYELGMLQHRQGYRDAAVEILSRAQELVVSIDEVQSPEMAPLLELEGHHAVVEGEHARALRYYDEALRLRRRSFGADHYSVGVLLDHRFESLRRLGREVEAGQSVQQALAILESRLGPEHPHLVSVLTHRAAYRASHEPPEAAWADYDRAIAIGIAAWGSSSFSLREPLVGRAALALRMGRSAAAERDARAFLALSGSSVDRDILDARAQWVLARALGSDPARAIEASARARQAAALFAAKGSTQMHDEIRAWLESAHAHG